MNFLFKLIFSLSGWKLTGKIPTKETKKAILAVCPHNTWKDVLLGLGARAALGIKIGFLGKAELFNGMFGWFFYAMGGKPLVRNSNMNQVEQVIASIKQYDEIRLAMAPEGTRGNMPKLKTGFYHIAVGAGIPIIRVGFDFANKQIIFAEPFMPTGNFQADMLQYFVPFFKPISGQNDWIKNYEEGKFQ